MVIELLRLYRDGWTDGLIFIKGILLCRSIELRWANNERNVSCVPEGVYPVAIIQHPKFGECLQINGVKGRSGILVHVANDAQKELRGCIAPVFSLSGNGKGQHSRLALNYIIENLKNSGEKEHFIDIKSKK
ncbi:MAG: hypothetical protein KA270_18080 [Saprospiraceae bacterium]|nr:hypothetical protein [Saprospiraceae bacterium]MBP6569088.1 hypothetical protein [Saprospiraceae bacterium]